MVLNVNRFGKILLGGIAVVFVIGGCATTAPPPITVEKEKWTSPGGADGLKLLSKHYDIRTTAKDTTMLDYIGPFMETAFRQYQELIPPVAQNSDPLVIYLFDTRDQWAAFTRLFVPEQAHTYLHIQAGGYMDHATATAVIHDIQRDRTLSLLAHEGFHQYVARFCPRAIPAWLNEGLATQWESFDLVGDRPVFTPKQNHLRKNKLREALAVENGLIELPELLRIHAGQAVLETGQYVRSYYAQVWSLVLLLREDPEGKYAERFAKLLADAGTERLKIAVNAYRAATPGSENISDGEAVFRQYITDDLEQFWTDYRAFAKYLVY